MLLWQLFAILWCDFYYANIHRDAIAATQNDYLKEVFKLLHYKPRSIFQEDISKISYPFFLHIN